MVILIRHFLFSSVLLLACTHQSVVSMDCPQYEVEGQNFVYAGSCGSNNYSDRCDTNDLSKGSCLCSGDSPSIGPYSYFICLEQCDGYSFKVNGECIQCSGGQFVGSLSKVVTSCNNGEGGICVTIDDGTIWQMDYVYSHTAVDNKVDFDPSMGDICATCPAGSFACQGCQYCSPCYNGQYSDSEGSATCTDCSVMTYTPNDSKGYTSCLDVEQGFYVSSHGQNGYQSCAAGYYAVDPDSIEKTYSVNSCKYDFNQTNFEWMCPEEYPLCFSPTSNTQDNYCSNACSFCPPGHFSNTSASTSCYAAPKGSYSTGQQPTVSYPCPIGTYADSEGSEYCTICPLGESTMKVGSTNSSDCVTCTNGVNPMTYECNDMTDDAANPLNDICWDRAQLLSLNNNIAVADLYKLMYIGIDGLLAGIDNTINVIQNAAKDGSSVNISTVDEHLEKISQAPETWLNFIWNETRLEKCAEALVNKMENDDDLMDLINYQFGNSTVTRLKWIAFWHCSGGTFGCAGNTFDSCPAALSCWRGMYSKVEPLLTAPGGITAFGYDPKGDTGRLTPKYSTTYIKHELEENVKHLVAWEATQKIIEGYESVMKKIEETAEKTQTITVEAINATLQVTAAESTTSLNSSYAEGNLFYEKSYYNHNVTVAAAATISGGPADLQTDVKKCQTEEKWKDAFDIIGATADIAAACVDPFTAADSVEGFAKAFSSISSLVSDGMQLDSDFSDIAGTRSWDPDTEMPPLPQTTGDMTTDQIDYNSQCSAWYLNAQKNLSKSLVTISSAYWKNLYLKNEETLSPLVLGLPDCGEKTDIITSVTTYLEQVKNFTNYGSQMTASEIELVPQLGNIATGLATIAATDQATSQLGDIPVQGNKAPAISTAPSQYQSVVDDDYEKRTIYYDITNRILGSNAALSFLMQQYLASFSIFQFCRSYSYSNAGKVFVSTGEVANCQEFSTNYLPSDSDFHDIIDSVVNNDTNVPSSVNKLQTNIINFATYVGQSPDAVGQSSGSYNAGTAKSLNIFIPYNNTQSDPNSNLNYGNLEEGTAIFSLSASSKLLTGSKFDVLGMNPMVFNVQAYWRGVTSDGSNVGSSIDVYGPYLIYGETTDTGSPSAYQLPSFQNEKTGNPQYHYGTSESYQLTPEQSCDQNILNNIDWPHTEETVEFCTPDIVTVDSVNPIVSNFLFPSLWSTWSITASSLSWADHDIDYDTLGLMVRFYYMESGDSIDPEPIQECYDYCKNSDNPLLGQEWCDDSCNCLVSNVSLAYCSCNIFDPNNAKTCPASSEVNKIQTAEYKIKLQSSSKSSIEESSIRHLQKKKDKKKNKKDNKKEKKNKKDKKKKKKKDKKKNKKATPSPTASPSEDYLCTYFYGETTAAIVGKCGDLDLGIIGCDEKKDLTIKGYLHRFDTNEEANNQIKVALDKCITEYFITSESNNSFDNLIKEKNVDSVKILLDGVEIATKS